MFKLGNLVIFNRHEILAYLEIAKVVAEVLETQIKNKNKEIEDLNEVISRSRTNYSAEKSSRVGAEHRMKQQDRELESLRHHKSCTVGLWATDRIQENTTEELDKLTEKDMFRITYTPPESYK